MTIPEPPAAAPQRPSRWLRGLALAGPLGLVAVLGVVYAVGGFGKPVSLACPGSAATAARLQEFVHGEVAALALDRDGRPAPPIAFKGPGGDDTTLAAFKGRTVLLNLWATWCVPCRKEMPALDRLQARLGGPSFQVVAINVDQAKLDRPQKFLAETGIQALPFYADPSAKVLQEVKAFGLPTSLLIDRNGCSIGTLAGPAAWDSADAQRLIEAASGAAAPRT